MYISPSRFLFFFFRNKFILDFPANKFDAHPLSPRFFGKRSIYLLFARGEFKPSTNPHRNSRYSESTAERETFVAGSVEPTFPRRR